jgi:hypothetical protein
LRSRHAPARNDAPRHPFYFKDKLVELRGVEQMAQDRNQDQPRQGGGQPGSPQQPGGGAEKRPGQGGQQQSGQPGQRPGQPGQQPQKQPGQPGGGQVGRDEDEESGTGGMGGTRPQ